MIDLSEWKSIKQLAADSGGFVTEGGARWQIFNAQKNGLAKHLRKVGKRVFIHAPGYYAWIDGQSFGEPGK